MTGEIPSLLPMGQRPTVGLIVSETGQWSWVSRSVGLAVSWIWAEDEERLPEWLRSEAPDAVMTSNRLVLTQVSLILCERRAPRWLEDWSLTSLIVATATTRRPMPGARWHSRWQMKHQALGGLTTVSVWLSAYSSIERRWIEPPPENILETTVASMASDTVDEGKMVQAPAMLFGSPAVTCLGRNLYHGGGLYPTDLKRGTRPYFVLTSVLAPTKWVKRRLTTVEEWTVKDVPVRIVVLAQNAGEDMNHLWKSLQPGRCLEKGLRRLFGGIQVIDKSGRVSGRWLSYGRGDEESPVEATVKRKLECIVDGLNELSLKKESKRPRQHFEGDQDRVEGEMKMELEGPEEWDSEEEVDVKATKSDDARVRESSWNREVTRTMRVPSWSTKHPALMIVRSWMEAQAMDYLREWMLRWYKRKTTRQFFDWKRKSLGKEGGFQLRFVRAEARDQGQEGITYGWKELGRKAYLEWWIVVYAGRWKETDAAWDAISRLANTSWWEWTDGSRCMHWKWPKDYQIVIRDGIPGWFRYKPTPWTKSQQSGKTPEEHERMKQKLQLVRIKRYIARGEVTSLTSFFGVKKGEDDTRMVYDGTKSGLNDALWVPSFPLPTVDTMLRAVTYDTVMSDFDIGDCFLNFVLHETLQALCGVDLTKYFGNGHLLWERWVRAAMGLKSSPYQAVQAIMVAKGVMLGNRKDPENAFRWDEVILNLPGSSTYDPGLPWVFKIRWSDGKIAADLFIYVDDGRVTASNKLECKKATRQAASRLNGLGIQEAARKRRWGSRNPGAWAGSMVKTTHDSVSVFVSQEKWDKTKAQIVCIHEELVGSPEGLLQHKALERKRGFLIYVTRTYTSMVPYLKGIHLTLDSWRKGRDEEGWKVMGYKGEETALSSRDAPEKVMAVPRLRDDLEALMLLTASLVPPVRRVRSKKVITVYYGFGDASAIGFCSTFQQFTKEGKSIRAGEKIHYRYGHWCSANSEASSNYRELLNLVEALELRVRNGELYGVEVFLFTDNSTAESVFYKGNSTSKTLFGLVLRLRRIELEGDLVLHLIHVSGKRMIDQGTDGGSRGDLNQGVMTGESMLNYIPLHLSAVDRSPTLVDWVRSWWEEKLGPLVHLGVDEWFTKGQEEGNYLWTPPPAAASVVAEQVGEARHKHPLSCHIVVVPRLMTGSWRRLMTRQTDFNTTIPTGVSFWPLGEFEPLTLFVYLPLIPCSPWSIRGTDLLASLDGELRSVRGHCEGRKRELLRELLFRTWKFSSLPESVVWEMLHRPSWESLSHKNGNR